MSKAAARPPTRPEGLEPLSQSGSVRMSVEGNAVAGLAGHVESGVPRARPAQPADVGGTPDNQQVRREDQVPIGVVDRQDQDLAGPLEPSSDGVSHPMGVAEHRFVHHDGAHR